MVDLAGLDERQRLEQLVEGAEATGEDDERLRIFHEHRLAHEEVAEVGGQVDVGVDAGLVGQVDAQADRDALGFLGTPVGGLHDAGPAAGDHREALLGQPGSERAACAYMGSLGWVRAEPKMLTAGPKSGQRIEAIDELAHDAQRTPGVRFEE